MPRNLSLSWLPWHPADVRCGSDAPWGLITDPPSCFTIHNLKFLQFKHVHVLIPCSFFIFATGNLFFFTLHERRWWCPNTACYNARLPPNPSESTFCFNLFLVFNCSFMSRSTNKNFQELWTATVKRRTTWLFLQGKVQSTDHKNGNKQKNNDNKKKLRRNNNSKIHESMKRHERGRESVLCFWWHVLSTLHQLHK